MLEHNENTIVTDEVASSAADVANATLWAEFQRRRKEDRATKRKSEVQQILAEVQQQRGGGGTGASNGDHCQSPASSQPRVGIGSSPSPKRERSNSEVQQLLAEVREQRLASMTPPAARRGTSSSNLLSPSPSRSAVSVSGGGNLAKSASKIPKGSPQRQRISIVSRSHDHVDEKLEAAQSAIDKAKDELGPSSEADACTLDASAQVLAISKPAIEVPVAPKALIRSSSTPALQKKEPKSTGQRKSGAVSSAQTLTKRRPKQLDQSWDGRSARPPYFCTYSGGPLRRTEASLRWEPESPIQRERRLEHARPLRSNSVPGNKDQQWDDRTSCPRVFDGFIDQLPVLLAQRAREAYVAAEAAAHAANSKPSAFELAKEKFALALEKSSVSEPEPSGESDLAGTGQPAPNLEKDTAETPSAGNAAVAASEGGTGADGGEPCT